MAGGKIGQLDWNEALRSLVAGRCNFPLAGVKLSNLFIPDDH